MIIPKIKKRYIYKGETVYVWHQDVLFNVFLKTEPIDGGAIFFKENWFKFAFNAKNYESNNK